MLLQAGQKLTNRLLTDLPNTKLDVLQSNRLTFIYHYARCSFLFDTASYWGSEKKQVQNSTKASRGMWIISGKSNLLLTDNAITRSQTTLRVCLSKARSKHVTQTNEVSELESPWALPCCSPFSHSRPGILHNGANQKRKTGDSSNWKMFCHIINRSRLRWLVWWSNDSHDTSWRSQTAALSHAVLRKSRTICQPSWRWKRRSLPIARAWSLALQYLWCRKSPSTCVGRPTNAANEIGMEFNWSIMQYLQRWNNGPAISEIQKIDF